MNILEIYQSNSKTVICTVVGLDSLVNYTCILTCKKNIADTEPKFIVIGILDNLNIIFDLTPTQTE